MITALAVALLLAHGLVHFAVWLPHPEPDPGKPAPFAPDRSAGRVRAAAHTSPASQPGARPSCGGLIAAVSCPLTASSHEIREFEFHISPAPISSSPHVAVGKSGTDSRSRVARSRSVLIRTGLCTA